MKNKILPIIAVVLVVVAVCVIVLMPNNDNSNKSGEVSNSGTQKSNNTKTSAQFATLDDEGNVVINKEDVSEDKISIIRYSEDSKVEIIAIKGKDGGVNVALGTCQSCNGSPYAYYTQSGDELQCNNCGLTFPLDVIGVDGTGCHPIKIDETGITRTEDGITINKDVLLSKEKLFSKIVAH